MKKRITAAILSFCMMLFALPVMASADTVQLGEGVENAWDISADSNQSIKAYYEQIPNTFSRKLIVTGSGRMYDYPVEVAPPWIGGKVGNDTYQGANIGDTIAEIVIQNKINSDGIFHIGSYAFYKCTKVLTISLPKSIKSIKGSSFPEDCTIVASDSDYNIEWYTNTNFTGSPTEPDAFQKNTTYYAKWVSKASSGEGESPTEPTPPSGGDQTNTGNDNNQPSTGEDETKPDDNTPQKQKYDTSNLKFENATVTFDGKPHSLQATGVPEGVTVTYEGNSQFIAGTYIVTAKFTGDSQHETIPDMEAQLTIEKASQDISFGYETLKVLTTDKTATNPLIGVKEQAAVTYTSSDEKVATVDKDGLAVIVGEGTVKITAITTETANYKQTLVSYTLTVAQTMDETDEKEESNLLTTEYPNGVKVSVPKEQGKVKSAIVTVPEKVEHAVVTIPLENVTYGTVAMNAKTGEIIKLCVPVSDGLAVEVNSTISLILFDNSKIFADIAGHWGEQYINFTSAHDIFAGTSDTKFTPNTTMTRGMMMTVIAKFSGVDVSGGSVWYERGMNWAKATGVSDGTKPMANITREQLVCMLYNYSGSPETTKSLSSFPDANKVSKWAVNAVKWAVENDIINGMGNGTLSPKGNATRVQTATIMTKYCAYLLGV